MPLNWKRKEYETWDDAFHGLIPAVRQQSVRVADYTRTLFLAAVYSSYGKGSDAGSARMRSQYGDAAYKCGLYHQLGKALVPPEYQLPSVNYTEEELALYRKYPADGCELVSKLQSRSLSLRERRKGEKNGYQTENIPWLMIREAALQHMERWDGSGYPSGLKGEAISPVAHITALCKELDRLSAETKSEKPFDEALELLKKGSGTDWDPALIEILTKSESAMREIYEKYIPYTKTLPKTVPLVIKRPTRPFGLKFRPMVSDREGKVSGCEAFPWFKLYVNDSAEQVEPALVEDMLVRTELITGTVFYFLYEAADALLRMENCSLSPKAVILNVPQKFYKENVKLQEFEKLFEDQPVDREKLILTVSLDTYLNSGKGVSDTIQKYLRNDISLMLDGFDPEKMSVEALEGSGFKYVRIDPSIYQRESTAKLVKELCEKAFTIIGGSADTRESLSWQLYTGAIMTGGTVTGTLVDENELINSALLKERISNGD